MTCECKANEQDADGDSGAGPQAQGMEYACLECGPNFGCIHWDEMPKERKLLTIEENAKKISNDRANLMVDFPLLDVPLLTPSGIICPDCGLEMMWNQSMYGFGPMSRGVECECGLKGGICTFTGHFGRVNEKTGRLMR